MRSPEVSVSAPVSIAARPSIGPSIGPAISRPSFGEFKPSPIASIVRNPGIFNPNISVNIPRNPGLSNPASVGGEKKPFSFGGTKPLEAPKSAPFADHRISGFNVKDFAPMSSLRRQGSTKDLNVSAQASLMDSRLHGNDKGKDARLDALFGPKLEATDINPKGSEKFGGLKTFLPKNGVDASVEVKIHWKPGSSPQVEVEGKISTAKESPSPKRWNERFSVSNNHLEPLTLVHKINKAESIQERIARLEQIPLIETSRQARNDTIGAEKSTVTPKGNERFAPLEPIPLLSLRDQKAARQAQPIDMHPVMLNLVQHLETGFPKQAGEERKVEVKRMLEVVSMTNIDHSTVVKAEIDALPIVARSDRLQVGRITEEEEDDEAQVLKAKPEFQALLKKRATLKAQGMSEIQLNRLNQLELRAQKMSEVQVGQWMNAVQRSETDVVGESEEEVDEVAMEERKNVLETAARDLYDKYGDQARINGEDIVARIPDEFTRKRMRSRILGDSIVYDGSITMMKRAILERIKGISLPTATRIAQQMNEKFRAVKRSSRPKSRVGHEEVRRVLQDGRQIRIPQTTIQLDRASAVS